MKNLERIIKDLGYEMAGRMMVYFCPPEKPVSTGLRSLTSEEEFRHMYHYVITRHLSLEVYIDHDESVRGFDWDDVLLFPVADHPLVISPKKIQKQKWKLSWEREAIKAVMKEIWALEIVKKILAMKIMETMRAMVMMNMDLAQMMNTLNQWLMILI
jgi:hypothetical protein